MRAAGVLLAAALWLSGCTTTGKALHYKEGHAAPDLLAVLPPDNESTDLQASQTYQRVVATVLVALGHLPMVSPAQEAALRGLGITDGGQLKGLKAKAVADALGVDGLVYGKVQDFKDLNLGVYRHRQVGFTSSVVSPEDEKLWEAEARGGERKVAMFPPGSEAELVASPLVTMIEKAAGVHLLKEASYAGFMLQKKAPEWPEPTPAKLRAIHRDLGR